MANKVLVIIPTIILIGVLASCAHPKPDVRLDEVEALLNTTPREGLDSLKAIDYSGLSDDDRHLYDLLLTKAYDKAYIEHTSDSLILDVIDYYSSSPKGSRYAESLYYGGRVYSDLGDGPTALKYFQMALDLLPKDTENLELRLNVLSQTGLLLNKLRLYEEAIPYIEECLESDISKCDTINEVYDLQLLGSIYLRKHDYDSAENCFMRALNKSTELPVSFQAKSSMGLAAAKQKLGQLDSALIFIRNIPDLVNPITRNTALAYAIGIYLDAGLHDTAYTYAIELAKSSDYSNRKIAYRALLSPEMRDYVTIDSVRSYAFAYGNELESYLNENENQLSINQKSLYNYQIHERLRKEAEIQNSKLMLLIGCSVLLILVLAIVLLMLKIRNKNAIIELQTALENIGNLEKDLKSGEEKQKECMLIAQDNEIFTVSTKERVEQLRERLRSKLLDMYEKNNDGSSHIADVIVQSPVYGKLQEVISQGRALDYQDPLWKEMEGVVLADSPQFKERLRLLTGGKLKISDFQIALLIKFGFSPKEMSLILNRTMAAIGSRRGNLSIRIFEKNLGTKLIDGIIRLL